MTRSDLIAILIGFPLGLLFTFFFGNRIGDWLHDRRDDLDDRIDAYLNRRDDRKEARRG
jgi:hypothetical protein